MIDLNRLFYFTLLLAAVFFGGWWLCIQLLDMPTTMDERRQNALAIVSLLSFVIGGMMWDLDRGAPPSEPH